MAKWQLPPVDEILQAVLYEPDTGKLFWREDRPRLSSRGNYGTGEAFKARMPKGYLFGGWKGRKLYAHRVAWVCAYGVWPSGEVDHINGVRDDNRLVNIRDATAADNRRNMRPLGGASEFKGVVKSTSAKNPWAARLSVANKPVHLGVFRTEKEAAQAYDDAARIYFGEFARLNFTD